MGKDGLMRDLPYPDWNVIERTDERIRVQGPHGYIRLRKTLSEPKPFDQWTLTVRWEGRFDTQEESLKVFERDELWDVVTKEIERISTKSK